MNKNDIYIGHIMKPINPLGTGKEKVTSVLVVCLIAILFTVWSVLCPIMQDRRGDSFSYGTGTSTSTVRKFDLFRINDERIH